VLVATDVAARGVHVDDVELVVHVDPPMEHKAYLHRSGRTARAGSEGDVVTLVLPTQEKDLAVLMRKAGIQAATQRVTPNSDAVVALIGDRADYVKPAPRAVAQQQGGGGRSQGANAQRKRAARSGDSAAQPRADRSGRPARSGARSGSASGSGRPARAGSGASASTRGGSSSYYSTSTGGGSSQSNRASAPTGNPRRGGRRAQG